MPTPNQVQAAPYTKSLLVLGATSEIAVATLHKLAQEGWAFHLAGRDLQALASLAHMLKAQYQVQATYSRFDTAMNIDEQDAFWREVLKATSVHYVQGHIPSHRQSPVPSAISNLTPTPPSELKDMPHDAQSAKTSSMSSSSAPHDRSNKDKVSPLNDGAKLNDDSKINDSQNLSLLAQHSTLTGVFCAVGYLGNPHQAEHNLKEGMLIMQANFGGLIPILSLAANYFEQKRAGMIVVISSVAGDRGRASNYPYGSAKAGMTAYLSGLRARLARSNVHVMTVLPGFVKTRMIADRIKTPRPCASVEEVAQDIMRGIHKRRSVVYSRWYWRYIMFGVKHLPEWIFKKVTL